MTDITELADRIDRAIIQSRLNTVAIMMMVDRSARLTHITGVLERLKPGAYLIGHLNGTGLISPPIIRPVPILFGPIFAYRVAAGQTQRKTHVRAKSERSLGLPDWQPRSGEGLLWQTEKLKWSAAAREEWATPRPCAGPGSRPGVNRRRCRHEERRANEGGGDEGPAEARNGRTAARGAGWQRVTGEAC
jgi:hypothetical protein